MGLAGELTTIGLAEVFQNLAFNHLTGTLNLQEGEQRAFFYFEEGRIRAVSVAGATFDYVDIARRVGAAPEAALKKAAGTKRRRTLKAFLRSIGDFDEDAYDAAVRAQVQEEILPVFGWSTGEFSFQKDKMKARTFDKEQLSCSIGLDPQGVAMEAARRMDEWEGMAAYVPGEREVLAVTDEWPEDFELLPEHEELVDLLDGTRDLAAAIEAASLKRFDVLKAVAHFVEWGVAVPVTAERLRELAARAKAMGEVNLAIARLEAALRLDERDLEARRELVRLLERGARKGEAALQLLRLGEAQNEAGDTSGALESYERASILAPQELDVLERIFEMHERKGETAKAMKAGRRLAEALVLQEMYEDAQPLFERLLQSNGQLPGLREAFANCLLKLGDVQKAASQFLLLANRAYEKANFESALRYYRAAVAADPACSDAEERIEAIETGQAQARVARRRRRLVWTGFVLLAGLLGWQGVREWQAQSGLHAIQHEATHRLSRDNGDRARIEVLQELVRVSDEHPFTRSGSLAQRTASAMLQAEIERIDTLALQAAGARTTAEIEFTLLRAEKLYRQIESLTLPDEIRAVWDEARDGLWKSLAKHRRTPDQE